MLCIVELYDCRHNEVSVLLHFARLDRELRGRRYLVGDQFSRADLTLAALAAPLIRPASHPRTWPDDAAYPRGWLEAVQPWADSLTAERVREMYRLHRPIRIEPVTIA